MDRPSFKHRFIVALCALVLLPGALRAAPVIQPPKGTWALRGGIPQIVSLLYALPSKGGTNLDVVQYRIGARTPLQSYTVEMTQLMHVIVVRDDFREFLHLHPHFSAGHFTVPIAIASGHRYYVYADSTPSGMKQQVFRFQIGAGAQPRTLSTPLSPSAPTAAVGPYAVHLSTTRLSALAPQTLLVSINKGGIAATDLHPYLGAAAHVVLINTSNLEYVHVHPEDTQAQHAAMGADAMAGMKSSGSVSGKMSLALPTLSRHAAYKLWLQFRGDKTVYVAPFTIVAQ